MEEKCYLPNEVAVRIKWNTQGSAQALANSQYLWDTKIIFIVDRTRENWKNRIEKDLVDR